MIVADCKKAMLVLLASLSLDIFTAVQTFKWVLLCVIPGKKKMEVFQAVCNYTCPSHAHAHCITYPWFSLLIQFSQFEEQENSQGYMKVNTKQDSKVWL